MIPIRDTTRSTNYPIVNNIIIALNVLVFIVEIAQGSRQNQFIITYGLVPARYSVPAIASYFSTSQQIFAFFSFMFLHGGFWHLLANMWFLYIFGDNVEDRLGPFRYLVFFLLCGWASGVFHLITNWHSQVPTIGASGAIAGVMGAYLVLYPNSRILTFIPIFFIPYFIEIPAFFFLGLWFLIQFFSAAASHGHAGGIAWWAHVGGFISGIVLLKVFERVPETGATRKLRTVTSRKKTPRLKVVRTQSSIDDPNIYGTISVTPQEAYFGTQKLINVPWGFHSRIFRVTIPPGVKDGTVLRLPGLGKRLDGGQKGDLRLKVQIRP